MADLFILIGWAMIYVIGLYLLSIEDVEWALEETNMMFTAFYPGIVGAVYIFLVPSKIIRKNRDEVVQRG